MEDSNLVPDGLEFCERHGTDITKAGCGECLADPVEAPESDPQPLWPIVGPDITPTPEMIARGAFGNGAWDLTDASVELAYEQRAAQIKEDKDERRKFFNEAAKDALADAIEFHHRLVKRGLEIMEKVEAGEALSRTDTTILQMAQKSTKELADRGMGRATAAQQESAETGLLSLLIRKDPQRDA